MVNAIAHIHIKPPRLTKQGFVAGAAAAIAVAGGVVLGIRLRFHNHAPQQLARRLPFHQQAADEVGSDDLGGAGEEGLGQGWEVLDRRGGYGGGWVRKCPGMLTGLMGWASNGELLQFHAMSEEQLSALLAKLKEDAGLQEKLKGAVDLDAAVGMAQEAGFDVSKSDWLRYQARQTLELSDNELEGVAGGLDRTVLGTVGICCIEIIQNCD